MTEKRFEKARFGTVIKDHLKKDTLWTATECIDRLNELADENEQLKNEIARLEMIITKLKNNDFENYEKKIQELNKENESLNETIKFIFRIQRQRLSKLQKKDIRKQGKLMIDYRDE